MRNRIREEPRLPRRPEGYRRVLSRVVASIDLPFGYTLSVWAAGHLVIGRFGGPSLGDVFLFVGGAVGGYLLTSAVAFPYFSGLGVRRIPGASLLNVLALAAAAVVSVIARFVDQPSIGFFLGGFAATTTYTLLLALLIHLGRRLGITLRRRER